jgi:hypothetical protein
VRAFRLQLERDGTAAVGLKRRWLGGGAMTYDDWKTREPQDGRDYEDNEQEFENGNEDN